MAIKTKRYTRAQVKAGKFELPGRYQFLGGNKYDAIVSRDVDGRVIWAVELGMALAKKLFNSDERTSLALTAVDKLMLENVELKKMLALQEDEMKSLKSEKDAMERNLGIVLANIENDSMNSPDFPIRKNFWSTIENVKNLNQVPLQGGSAGSKKK